MSDRRAGRAAALEKVRIDRGQAYVTKWVPRGKRRIHSKPSSLETKACLPWLEAELVAVQPEVIVLLGATAARALLGASFVAHKPEAA